MKLIGMLDSPYVRRVAICLDALGLPFRHEAVSVFSDFERFHAINPVVKAPTLICDDGGVLMDSTLILQYVEAQHGVSLWAQDESLRLRQFRTLGLALAGCEKAVQLVYETNLRPAATQHEPWKARVRQQMHAAFDMLEPLLLLSDTITSADLDHSRISAAVVWQFVQSQPVTALHADRFPRLGELSRQCEALAVFQRWPPVGPGVQTRP